MGDQPLESFLDFVEAKAIYAAQAANLLIPHMCVKTFQATALDIEDDCQIEFNG